MTFRHPQAMVGVLEQPWTLTAAAAVVVVRHHSAFIVVVIAFALFTLASTATVGLIYLYYARRPGEAEAHRGVSTYRRRLVQVRVPVTNSAPTGLRELHELGPAETCARFVLVFEGPVSDCATNLVLVIVPQLQ